MKFCTLFILLALTQVHANTFGQLVTVVEKNKSIETVFKSIEKQSGYHFFYNKTILDVNQKVTINISNTTVDKVLDQCFKDLLINYKIIGNTIVLKSKEEVFEKQDTQINGKVTDQNGDPLPGVSVSIQNENKGTVTDNNGNFSINVLNKDAVLVFSFLGFAKQEVKVDNQTFLNISMVEKSDQLNQIVVVGYGLQRKVDVTGAITTIKGSDIAAQPSTNVLSGLQGKVAGLQINNDGSPGTTPQIRIRGVGTISGNLNPLFIVDGVWVSDISFLNSSDIASLSVLKDASSAAIYGNLAANGVILITTKKGKIGPPVVQYNASAGWQHITNQVQMADAQQYATLANEVSVGSGGTSIYNANTLYDPAKSNPEGTDWFRQVLRDAFLTNHNLSFTGGTEQSNYRFSLSALNQNGLVKTQGYQRYTANLQNDYKVKPYLTVGYSIIGNYRKSNPLSGDIFRQLYAAPSVIPVKYADGKYGDPVDFALNSIGNPEVTIDFNNQKDNTYGVIGNTFFNIDFSKKISLRSNFNFESSRNDYRNYTPVYAATFGQFNTISNLYVQRSQTNNWMYENVLQYQDTYLKKHSLKLILGQTARRNNGYYLNGNAKNVPYDYKENSLYLSAGSNSSISPTTANDGGSLETGLSYFGRLNYAYDNKYLLTATLRSDGSSKYTGDYRWGYFPAVGLGWIISNEKFMNNQDLFSLLKLRGSWGITGNTSVPANITQLTASNLNFAVWNGQAFPSRSINTQVPTYLYWEKGISTDIALEGELLNSKLSFEIDVYNRDTEDAIFAIPTLSSLGTVGGITANQASIRNRGLEISTSYNGQIGKEFTYSIGANYSYNTNKVTKVNSGSNAIYGGGYSNPSGTPLTKTVLGQPIGQFWGYEAIGVFQNKAEVTSSPQSQSASPGDLKFKDQDGNGIIDDRDKIYMGNPNPKSLYGLNFSGAYKSFDFSLDLQGVAGVQIYNANLSKRFGIENFTEDFFNNRWHGAGTSNSYPSANILNGLNTQPNTFWVQNGNYLRIRNIQAGYTFKKFAGSKESSLRIYSAVQNPFNFFNYKGFSPEVTAANNNPLNAGIDQGVYPLSAIYNFGINLTF